MTVVSSKEFAGHQEKYYDLAVNGRNMLGCDPANTYALKSAPVLEGDEAIEFLERVEANLKVPLQSRPSKKEREEWEELFRKHDLDKLKNGL